MRIEIRNIQKRIKIKNSFYVSKVHKTDYSNHLIKLKVLALHPTGTLYTLEFQSKHCHI